MSCDYFDSHCHLGRNTVVDFGYSETELTDIVAGLERERIGVLNLTTDAATIAALESQPSSDFIWAGVGFHPTDSDKFNLSILKSALLRERVIAIGEIGLDDYRLTETERRSVLDRQLEAFEAQLKLAKTQLLPVSIHLRGSKEIFALAEEMLRRLMPLPPVNLHFFTGDLAMAQRCAELGCFFSFGGVIFRDQGVRDLLCALPIERLLSETDSPFIHPTERGLKNTPLTIPLIVAEMERIRGETLRTPLLENTGAYLGLALQ